MTDFQQLPAPLTPPDCDLRDFAFMPLDVLRLRDSDLAVKADGESFRCAVLLWCASWHQVPAASLPDDDDVLAQLAGFGRVTKEWLRHRDGALRGWVKCADGRLYHPVVAEKAAEAWRAKMIQRWKTECARIKKHNQRHETNVHVPDLDEWLSLGCPQGQPIAVPGTKKHVPKDTGSGPEGHPPSVPRETHSKGQGEGQGQGQGQYLKEEMDSARATDSGDNAGSDGGYLPDPTPHGTMAKLLRAQGLADANPGNPTLRVWVDNGLTAEEAIAGLATARATRSAPNPMTWAYLARVLETQRERAAQCIPEKPTGAAGANRQEALEAHNREVARRLAAGEANP